MPLRLSRHNSPLPFPPAATAMLIPPVDAEEAADVDADDSVADTDCLPAGDHLYVLTTRSVRDSINSTRPSPVASTSRAFRTFAWIR